MNRREEFEGAFRELFEERWRGSPLFPIVEYALFPGGKRLRPLLCYAVCTDLGGASEDALGLAAAVECLHIASLIHDDLPCLDDDSIRRGQPTCHVQFGEAAALLAGDALASWAFELGTCSPRSQAAVVRALSRAFVSLCTGQLIEIQKEPHFSTSKVGICELKTGALFGVAMRLGALCAQGEAPEVELLIDQAGRHFGVLFQAQDDREDGESVIVSQEILINTWSSLSKVFTSLHDKSGRDFLETKSVFEGALLPRFMVPM